MPRRSPSSVGLSALAALIALGGCANLRGSERSTVSTSQTVASAHWFRGTPLALAPVTQADLTVNTPLASGGTISLVTWYNAQLTNRTGDAWFPDGHGGETTELDLVANYAQRVRGLDLSFGGIAYTYPDVRPSTKEAYVSAARDVLGLAHALTAYYDVDQADDYYLQYQAARSVALDEHWSAAMAVLLGYMSDGQAQLHFGKKSAGFSDVLVSGTLTFRFDDNTSFFLRGAGVTVPDDGLERALEQAGLEDGGLWLTLGAAWGL
jgi:hypothetical protein